MSEPQELVYKRSHVPGGEPESFEEQLREQFRHAPWLVVSFLLHAAVGLILSNMVFAEKTKEQKVAIQAEALPEDIEPIIEEPPPPPPEEPEEIEEIEEDPEISEEVVDDLLEDDNQAPLDSPFDSRNFNSVIGVGGGAGPGGFRGKYARRGSGRSNSASQKAVDLGLQWLKKHQAEDGSWGAATFNELCEQNRCDGVGHFTQDIGVTALSLLAFLGAGNSMTTGKYKETVKKGLRFLLQQQDRDLGMFGRPNEHTYVMYGHAISTLAMVEAYHISHTPMLKRPAQKGLDFIAQARNQGRAWKYEFPPNGQNDTSVTGWMLFALFAGKDAGLNVDLDAIADGMAFIEDMTSPSSGRTGYETQGSVSSREEEGGHYEAFPPENSECLTAVAVLLRVFNGEDIDSSPIMLKGADLMMDKLPKWDESSGEIDFYYWYYGSYALWQISGKYWKQWQGKMLDSIVANQRKDGDELGSWDPQVDVWGHVGGRVYATAINTLCLEVYYRYDNLMGAR